ncbi:MAG: hypothetical protein J6K29_10020, partial [Clostridia bacterium]|nr:hypothetical protein [Clostridia bacterium]
AHCRRAEYEENCKPMLEGYLRFPCIFYLPSQNNKAYPMFEIDFVSNLWERCKALPFKLGFNGLLVCADPWVLPSHPPVAGTPPEGEPPRKFGREAVRGQITKVRHKQTVRQTQI